MYAIHSLNMFQGRKKCCTSIQRTNLLSCNNVMKKRVNFTTLDCLYVVYDVYAVFELRFSGNHNHKNTKRCIA